MRAPRAVSCCREDRPVRSVPGVPPAPRVGLLRHAHPWGLGSARVVMQLGFPALTTTISVFVWSQGRSDNRVPLEEGLAHLRSTAKGVEIPINGNSQGGFGA